MTGGGPDIGGARASHGGLAHRPGLDGLRAAAVGSVVLFHLDRLPGGNLGVDAFFVLSGWLITRQLLVGAARDPLGRIYLGRFWRARLRRLAPASLTLLVVVSFVWSAANVDVPSLRRDLLWALGWASNWGTISGHGDYWARFGEQSPVTHFWSLAVEAQLYLGWPLLVYVVARHGQRRRDVTVAVVGALLAVASVAFMVASFDASRPTATYLNTLARAHSLLIGAVAAALMSASSRLHLQRVARLGAPFAAVVALGIIARSSDTSTWLYSWGYPVFAIAIAIIVVAVADGLGVRWLGSRCLRWIGDRSYGIYLWHWPVILYLRGDRAPLDGPALDALRVAVSVSLAAVSYRWIEVPVRRGTVAIRWAPAAAIGALAAVAALVFASGPTAEAPEVRSTVALPVASPRMSLAAAVTASLASSPADASEDAATSPVVPAVPAGPVRVLVVGDSTAVLLAEALIPYAEAHASAIVAGSAAYGGCGLSAADDGRLHSFTTADGRESVVDLRACTTDWTGVVDRVLAEQIDVVLVDIGPWDGVDMHFPDGRTLSVLDPVGRGVVADSYRRFVSNVEGAGAHVVWVTPADLHLAWRGVSSPLDDSRRWAALREIIARLPVDQIDLPDWLRRNGLDGPDGRPDGVHLRGDVNADFVSSVVVPRLIYLGSSRLAGAGATLASEYVSEAQPRPIRVCPSSLLTTTTPICR